MVHENGLDNQYVGRPGIYGNPFKLEEGIIYVDSSNRRQFCDSDWRIVGPGTAQMVQDLFLATITDNFLNIYIDLAHIIIDVKYWVKRFENVDIQELRGKNLYCFCPIFNKDGSRFPCHADVLLEIANKEGDTV